MAKIFVFLADGFEEIEALAPVDILSRGGQDVYTVSTNGSSWVTGSHGITVKADMLFEDAPLEQADMLLLPGGMPGSKNLDEHEGVCEALVAQDQRKGRIGAICAAPMVLGHLGLLKGRRATCSPGFESHLTGAEYTKELYTIDGHIITGEGPAASLPYAYRILEMFSDKKTVQELQYKMQYLHLIGQQP